MLVDGTEIAADLFSNVDLPFTYAHLLHEQGSTNEEGSRDQGSTTKEEFHAEGSENKEGPRVRAGGQDADRLAGLDYSSGVVSFYWPLRALPPGSGPDPATPSISDPSAAPAGGHSVMVLVPCGCMPEDRASPALYEKVVEDAREAVLARLERQGVPASHAELHGGGAAFGLSHRLSQLVIFRPPNRDPKVGNLFFVGASTTPGNGVPLVLASARMTAAHILSLF
ncbi:hypothetical protein T484DRAFT_1812939 [Baffinella frigidus]|nr:hypothetical protein T484DRAFT_1812939 [Cryptophyta sp. CCMP2293]